MAVTTVDPAVQFVLDNIQTIVASEGGSLDLLDLRDGRLEVRYNKGYNEECPECVPDHDMVRQMMQTSLSVHAPHIEAIELV
jgi:hypothetical protein